MGNTCITSGQQLCTMSLAAIEITMPLEKALPYVFMLAGFSLTLAAIVAAFLNDSKVEDEGIADASQPYAMREALAAPLINNSACDHRAPQSRLEPARIA